MLNCLQEFNSFSRAVIFVLARLLSVFKNSSSRVRGVVGQFSADVFWYLEVRQIWGWEEWVHAGFCWQDYWVGLNCESGLCWGLWLLWNLLGGKVGNEWVMVVALVRGWVLIGWKKETDSHGR